jgi:hypothetical protein
LQKREEVTPVVVEPAAAPPSGGRPPRISKQAAPQAEVVKPATIAGPKTTPVTPEPVVAAAEPLVPESAMESEKEPVSSRKRKLRGIRIKNMNEDSEK